MKGDLERVVRALGYEFTGEPPPEEFTVRCKNSHFGRLRRAVEAKGGVVRYDSATQTARIYRP